VDLTRDVLFTMSIFCKVFYGLVMRALTYLKLDLLEGVFALYDMCSINIDIYEVLYIL